MIKKYWYKLILCLRIGNVTYVWISGIICFAILLLTYTLIIWFWSYTSTILVCEAEEITIDQMGYVLESSNLSYVKIVYFTEWLGNDLFLWNGLPENIWFAYWLLNCISRSILVISEWMSIALKHLQGKNPEDNCHHFYDANEITGITYTVIHDDR